MRNIDKIRQMTADKLADLLCCVDYTCCDECLAHDYCDIADNDVACGEILEKWLEQEAEE